MVHSHDVNLGVVVIVVAPVGADAGGQEIHLSLPAEAGKDFSTDVLIGKCRESLHEVLVQLVQDNLPVVQLQLPLIGIDIAEPEPQEAVGNEIQSLPGLFRILLRDRRLLFDEPQIRQCCQIGRQRGRLLPQHAGQLPQLLAAVGDGHY